MHLQLNKAESGHRSPVLSTIWLIGRKLREARAEQVGVTTRVRHTTASQVRCLHPNAHVEVAEKRVDGTDFVEPHFVDQFFEYQRLVGKQVDTPFPIVNPMEPLIICFTPA